MASPASTSDSSSSCPSSDITSTPATKSKVKPQVDTNTKASTNRIPPSLKVHTQKAISKGPRLPSLQQISQRLAVPTATAAAAATTTVAAAYPALVDVTATAGNLPRSRSSSTSNSRSTSPSGSTSSRLKLPASALTRANLNSAFVKTTENTPSKDTKELAAVTESPDKAPDSMILTAEPASMTSSSPSPAKFGDSRRARQSLGVGLPGLHHPETPQRNPNSETDVPDLVLVKSTPERTAETEKRVTNDDGEHPLAHEWTLFYDSKTYKPDPATVNKENHLSSWEAQLLTVGTVNTVEGFARHMNNIRLPSTLAKGANYHLFKDGIRPMWEDPANKAGGKWVMLFRGPAALLDAAWASLAMSLVGEMLDSEDKVCGVVVSARPKLDRIQVWTRGTDDIEYLNSLAQRILDTLAFDPREMENVSLEFQPQASAAKADPKLTKITFATSINRSVSLANFGGGGVGGTSLRRSPSSPGSALGAMTAAATAHAASNGPHGSSHLANALNGSPVPMRRSGSAGANAFSGPLGAARRLVSTTVESS